MFQRIAYSYKRRTMYFRIQYQVWNLNRDVARAFPDPQAETLRDRLEGPLNWAMESGRWQKMVLVVVGVMALYVGYGAVTRIDWQQVRMTLTPKPAPKPTPPPAAPAAMSLAAVPGEEADSEPAVAAPAASVDLVMEAAKDAQARMDAVIPEGEHALVASKFMKTLFVFKKRNDGWIQVRKYDIGYGEHQGDKRVSGDRKTPEGLYWIDDIVSGPSQGPLYGALVYKLNYPNFRDQLVGKNGDGIWIHGVEFGEEIEFTRGCIELRNPDVVDLAQYVKVGTPVLIIPGPLDGPLQELLVADTLEADYARLKPRLFPSGKMGNAIDRGLLRDAEHFVREEKLEIASRQKLAIDEQARDRVLARLESWRSAWSARDVRSYAANFHPEFEGSQGRGAGDFMDRKKRIFQSKDSIEVVVSQPRLLNYGDDMVAVRFQQDYKAFAGGAVDNSSMTKTLVFKKAAEGWLIVKE